MSPGLVLLCYQILPHLLQFFQSEHSADCSPIYFITDLRQHSQAIQAPGLNYPGSPEPCRTVKTVVYLTSFTSNWQDASSTRNGEELCRKKRDLFCALVMLLSVSPGKTHGISGKGAVQRS